MTLNELENFIEDEYDMYFADDSIFGNWITIEQELESLHKALMDLELSDSWDDIKKEIKFLEKYRNKGYQMKYALNGIWSQGWFICKINDNNYEFVDFYRTI